MSEFYSYDRENLDAKTIDLYCRWLYQTARADGKPRVLHFGSFYVTPISRFIDRLKQVKAKGYTLAQKYLFSRIFSQPQTLSLSSSELICPKLFNPKRTFAWTIPKRD
jgi:hypothetical protein